jgi:hypothetical protein
VVRFAGAFSFQTDTGEAQCRKIHFWTVKSRLSGQEYAPFETLEAAVHFTNQFFGSREVFRICRSVRCDVPVIGSSLQIFRTATTGANIMTSNQVTTSNRSAVEAFLKKQMARGRIAFVIDATASRQQTWDQAARLQNAMFRETANIGGLDMQLVYYRGIDECRASRWVCDGQTLARIMSEIFCRSGETQIATALTHVRREHAKQKINAVILISDACEEVPERLYAEAHELGAPIFAFQEGGDAVVAEVYRELAKITSGAYSVFDAGSAGKLRELLCAVAAFATGGIQALEKQQTSGARLLLTQMQRGDR